MPIDEMIPGGAQTNCMLLRIGIPGIGNRHIKFFPPTGECRSNEKNSWTIRKSGFTFAAVFDVSRLICCMYDFVRWK